MGNNEAPTEIWRVPSGGGAAERVVGELRVWRRLRCRQRRRHGLIYAGDSLGGPLNLWWRPLPSGREHRITRGVGDYLTPRISRDGRRLVCEARTSTGSLRVLDLRAPAPGLGRSLTGGGAEDAAPSTARNGRMTFSSSRNGTRDVWISEADGTSPRP